jgi:hypothetical protein
LFTTPSITNILVSPHPSTAKYGTFDIDDQG